MGDERAGETPGRTDAAHLDEDAEALEDPVHAGEARHQHEQHEHDRLEHEQDERRPHERDGLEGRQAPR